MTAIIFKHDLKDLHFKTCLFYYKFCPIGNLKTKNQYSHEKNSAKYIDNVFVFLNIMS